MRTVIEIIEAVKNLGVEEKGEFLTRLSEVNFHDEWDRQMEADAQAGRLDPLWQQPWKTSKLGGRNRWMRLSTKSNSTSPRSGRLTIAQQFTAGMEAKEI